MKNLIFLFIFVFAAVGLSAQTDLLPGGVKGRDAGSDSTFLKVGGSAVEKRPSDNIYKPAGTLGLGTADTGAYFNMLWPANSLKPLNQWNYGDASTNGFNFIKLKSTGQTDNPTNVLGDWNFWVGNFVGINAPFATRANSVMRFGYNTGVGGGRILPNDADLHISFESSYNAQQPVGNLPTGARVWEWHLQSQDTLGIGHRVITAIGSHNGNGGQVGFASDGVYFERYNLPGTNWLQASRFTKNWDFVDSMVVRFNKNGRGAGGLLQMNGAGNALLDLVYANSADEVVNGGTGVSATRMPHGNLAIEGTGNIYNNTGNVITIGKTGARSNLEVNGNNTEVLKLRNSTQPTRTWTHAINDDNFVFTSYSGTPLMQFYNNGALLTSANNKFGIGTDTRGRFTIQQISNTGQGGMMFVPFGALSEFYQQVNGNSEMAFRGAAGGDIFALTQSGSLSIGPSAVTPTRTLDIFGEVRIRDLTTDAPTRFIGADADGDVGELTFGSQLTTSGTNVVLAQNGASTNNVLTWNGTTWAPAANTSESTKIGAFSNTATNQGLTISGDSIKMTAADITHPGGINLTGQVISAGTQQKTISADNGIQLRLDDPLSTKSAGFQLSEGTGANIMAQMTATSPDADNGNVQLKVEDTGQLETYIEVGALTDRKGVYEKGGQYEDAPKLVTTSTYTLQYGDRNLHLDATDMVLTLQEIGTSAGQTKPGRVAWFFNDNATAVTLTGGSGQDIIDANTLLLSANTAVTLIATASGKWIIKG